MSTTTSSERNCCHTESESFELDVVHENRPGAPTLDYRLGRYSDFFRRMLNRLPSERVDEEISDRAPLERLTYRGTDDPTIALLDTCAVLLDVLSFYQERIANEGYVRTAIERRSVLELVRAIGYEMRPGVAAGTLLAFVADDGPDTPDSIVVPRGTQVLSIPKKDEKPRTYETIEDIETRAEWNQLGVRPTIVPFHQEISERTTQVRINRGVMRLQPNDVVLLVDALDPAAVVVHGVRRVRDVTNEPESNTALVRFRPDSVPGSATSVSLEKPALFAFQTRSSLFGHNATDPVGQWYAVERRLLPTLPGDTEVSAVALRSVDELGFIALASTNSPNSTLKVWNIETAVEIISQQHNEHIAAAAFSPDGQYVATCSRPVLDSAATKALSHLVMFDASSMSPVSNVQEHVLKTFTAPVDPSELASAPSVVQIWFTSADPTSGYLLIVVDDSGHASQWNFQGSSIDSPGGDINVGNPGGDPLLARDSQELVGLVELDGRNDSVILRTRRLDDAIPWPDVIDASSGTVDLAQIRTKLVPESWAVLDDPQETHVRWIEGVSVVQAQGFGLQRRVSRMQLAAPSSPEVLVLSRRETDVYTESVELPLAAMDMALPVAVAGDGVEWVELDDDQVAALPGLLGRTVIVQGTPGLVDYYREAGLPEEFALEILALDAAGRPKRMVAVKKSGDPVWYLQDGNGSGETQLVLGADYWISIDDPDHPTAPETLVPRLIPWRVDDKLVHETKQIVKIDVGEQRLRFKEPLQHTYDTRTMCILGNVAMATHGETVHEVLGSGDGLAANQLFTLKKPPLTYIPGATASGLVNSLSVRVNGVLWQEQDSLLMSNPGDEVFIVRTQDDGRTEITFGDGLRGARLPSGAENVVATYRSGSGLEGELDAGQLQLLKTRPLGITEVVNPFPATGGAAREQQSEARENAPRTVLVLGRVVSLQDYEDFAKSYPGVGKAKAVAIWDGRSRFVHLTIGTEGGQPIVPGTPVYTGLREALDSVRNTSQRLVIEGYRQITFGLVAAIKVDPRYEADSVKLAVEQHLIASFSYSRRNFGQRVEHSEVIVAIQEVKGVVMVDLDGLSFTAELDGRSALLILIDPFDIDIEVRP